MTQGLKQEREGNESASQREAMLSELLEEADFILSVLEDLHNGAVGNDISQLRYKIREALK